MSAYTKRKNKRKAAVRQIEKSKTLTDDQKADLKKAIARIQDSDWRLTQVVSAEGEKRSLDPPKWFHRVEHD